MNAYISDSTTFDIVTAPKKDSRHWTPGTVTWDEIRSWLASPADVKECGNYMLGTLRQTTVKHTKTAPQCHNYHRTKVAVVHRSALSLDIDYPTEDFLTDLDLKLPYAAAVHTTFKSTALEPRYRLIIPLDRVVAPDEYHAAAGAVMQLLGEGQFDPGSVQAERYMFMPSAGSPEDYYSDVLDGPLAPADALLTQFNPDLSALPAPKPHKNKRDPFGIEGTIGAFNRAYQDFADLITEYDLPYETAGEERWHLVGASAAAGMSMAAEGLVYSHHSNDPAYGVMCSAFDLARLHLYGDLDEGLSPQTPVNRRPSHTAMLETATEDLRVVRELIGSDFDEDMDATADAITGNDWQLGFTRDPRTGTPKDEIGNWDLIARHDPAFRALYFNELTMAIETNADLPWRKLTPGRETIDGKDRSSLALHIERTYSIRPPRAYLDDLVNDVACHSRRVNPVRDYLESLRWDGKPRMEVCLPGVTPTTYTRMVARKVLVAAVARMYEPGIKWDHMLILFGPEGLGKSWWVDKMARGYSSELGPIGNKDTLIALQRSWIMLADESTSLRKSDFDAQKSFITQTADVFRMPYDREAGLHKRHCVIWGTTNDQVFLRRQEGNRRFLIVKSEGKVDFDQLTDHYIDQVWAEAVAAYRAGEKLFIEGEWSEMAAEAREDFTEEDALSGQIQSYMDTLVPENWNQMSPETRQFWLENRGDDLQAVGDTRIDRVCSVQLWVEALGNRRGMHRRTDLLEITKALQQLPGWRQLPGNTRIGPYGPQKVFERIVEVDTTPTDDEDSIW